MDEYTPWYVVCVSEFKHPRRGKPPVYEHWYEVVFEDDFETFEQEYAGAWVVITKAFATKPEATEYIGEETYREY